MTTRRNDLDAIRSKHLNKFHMQIAEAIAAAVRTLSVGKKNLRFKAVFLAKKSILSAAAV